MLVTLNTFGNVHETCSKLRHKWYAKYLLQVVPITSTGCIAIFKMNNRANYERLYKELGYREDMM